jgi:hypothetical protein
MAGSRVATSLRHVTQVTEPPRGQRYRAACLEPDTRIVTRAMSRIYEETWAILEPHFLTRPHLIDRAQEELAQCFDSLTADGRVEPSVLKDLACRRIQLKYGPAPARYE